jgi:TonB family protein
MPAPDSILGISLSVFLIASAQNNQQQEATPKVIRKSDAELKAAAITRVSPEPTSIAKAAKASGKVEVEVMIDESGNVVSAEAITGNALLRGVARDAARQWKFNPALLSETPTKVTGVITFDFEAESPTREDQESLQSFVASIGRPGYAAPTTPEAVKKLRLAEEVAERFIERFHHALDLGMLFDEFYVSNRAQRRRNIYLVLSTAPNNHLGWEKKFGEAIVREGFIAFMNEYLLKAEYALTLQRSPKLVDVAVATRKKIDLVFHTRVFKLKRGPRKRSRDSASSPTLRQNPAAEVNDETPAHSSTTVCRGRSSARASAAGDQDHSRTPGGKRCK